MVGMAPEWVRSRRGLETKGWGFRESIAPLFSYPIFWNGSSLGPFVSLRDVCLCAVSMSG